MSDDPVAVRRATLDALGRERFDLLVIGGGIVGCGVLLDAASRGLTAALVEQDDIAAGTSGRSSRLIHGGLRYLEQLRFGLVKEALEERSLLLRLAPHLVRIEPFLFPIFGLPVVHQAFYGAGILLYDLLGSRRDGGFARHVGPAGARSYAPQLRRKGLAGGIVYHDGVEDDARLALAVARTAIGLGGRVATGARAMNPILEGGVIAGAEIVDRETGATIAVRADRVIDATGAWIADPATRFGAHPGALPMRPSRGSHVVIARDRLEARGGLTLRIPGRVVFIIPWPDRWIIGTTDHPDDRSPAGISAPAMDVDELLGTVNAAMDVGLSRDDVLGTYAGMRPLVGDPAGDTVRASREHRITTERSGLVRVSGGKYTTYRIMARDAVDAALGEQEAKRRPSASATTPVVGAAPLPELDRLVATLSVHHGLDDHLARRLVDRHGTQATAIAALGAEAGTLRPLAAGLTHLEAEVTWAARHELASGIDDVLSRRMRLTMELPDRAASIAPRTAELLGAELGWDAARRAAAVEAFLVRAATEYSLPTA